MAVDWVQTAFAAGGFAAGTGVGLFWSHFTLRFRREELDRAMERAEYLLNNDAASSAKEIETSLVQLTAAAEATKAANDRAKIAEARVATLAGAFHNLRSDPKIRRIGKFEKPSKRLAPKLEAPPPDADAKRTPRYRAAPAATVEKIEHAPLDPIIAEH